MYAKIPALRSSVWLPRFLQRGALDYQSKLHATSYLDALRGYAAWIVFNLHRFPLASWPIFRLPFICTIQSGKGMVDVFFVISGFVLSQRMLKQIRAQQKPKLMDSLTSSVFRRYIRLYLPCILASFVSMCTVHWLGAKHAAPPLNTFGAQLLDWLSDMVAFTNPFAGLRGWWNRGGVLTSRYLDTLWTIPIEFRGSMVVYLYCAATARLTSKHRLTFCGVFILLCLVWQTTDVAMFLCGAFLAEVSLIRHPERYEPKILVSRREPIERAITYKKSFIYEIGYIWVFTLAIFLLDMPKQPSKGYFPWPLLSTLAPPWWDKGTQSHFWFVVASPLLIWSVDSSLWLQKPFCWNFSQYLGELSFGIYLMHLVIVQTLWDKVLGPLARDQFHNSPWILVPMTPILWFVVFWVADYFDRVDRRIVALGRSLQDRFFESW